MRTVFLPPEEGDPYNVGAVRAMKPSTAHCPRLLLLCCIVALPGWTGCAPRDNKSLKNLQLKLDELAQQREDDQRDIQELDSRLFLLEDKVDTLKVLQQRKAEPKRHPVIRIVPNKSLDEVNARPASAAPSNNSEILERSPSTGGESMVESNDVEYSGRAKDKGPRPLLRLHGASSAPSFNIEPSSSPRRRPQARPVPGNLNNERLSVVPLAPGSASAQAAAAPLPEAPAPRSVRQAAETKPVVQLYQQGFRQYRAGNYTGAIKIFKSFVATHGHHDLADNALYWLGECYYDTRNYSSALAKFRQVVESYPDGNKVPDSMLKMAFCYMNLGDKKAACGVLKQAVERSPGTRVSKLAAAALKKNCK